jgi:hypothetical protein
MCTSTGQILQVPIAIIPGTYLIDQTHLKALVEMGILTKLVSNHIATQIFQPTTIKPFFKKV